LELNDRIFGAGSSTDESKTEDYKMGIPDGKWYCDVNSDRKHVNVTIKNGHYFPEKSGETIEKVFQKNVQ
jgi:hypothetical protein